MLTITHTRAEGTLLDGTSRGDGTADILKANSWRWSRQLGAWYVRSSRDRSPNLAQIEATAAALDKAGHPVQTEIDDTPRSTAEVEADRTKRAEERALALATKAERAATRAQAAQDKTEQRMAALPPMGEPVKVGHHSEGRHRRDLQRAGDAMDQSIAAHEHAAHEARRATTAAAATGARYSPVTVANRIDTLEAEQRADERARDGYRSTLYGVTDTFPPATGNYRELLEARLTERADQIAYWHEVRNQQIADGTATNYGPDTTHTGDRVKIGGHWYRVVRANARTVTVQGDYGNNRVPYPRIQDHQHSTAQEGTQK